MTAGHRLERHVFKYPLPKLFVTGEQVVRTYEAARVVLVGHQDHIPTVWMEVSLTSPEERRLFHIYGTGQPVSDYDIHVGSYIDRVDEGDFVWHIYESNP